MTVHCVEVMASEDVDVQKVRNKIADLKAKYGEKLSKQNMDFTQWSTLNGTVSFYRGSFRVKLSAKESEKADLLDQLTKEMDKSASWWQARWHECDHDEESKTGCSWDTLEWAGTIPSEVAW